MKKKNRLWAGLAGLLLASTPLLVLAVHSSKHETENIQDEYELKDLIKNTNLGTFEEESFDEQKAIAKILELNKSKLLIASELSVNLETRIVTSSNEKITGEVTLQWVLTIGGTEITPATYDLQKLIINRNLGEFEEEDFSSEAIIAKVIELNDSPILKPEQLVLNLETRIIKSTLENIINEVELEWAVIPAVRVNLSEMNIEPVLSDTSETPHQDAKTTEQVLELIATETARLKPGAQYGKDYTVEGNMDQAGIITVKAVEGSFKLEGQYEIIVKTTLKQALKELKGFVVNETSEEDDLINLLIEKNPEAYESFEEAKEDLNITFQPSSVVGKIKATLTSKEKYWNDEVQVKSITVNYIKVEINTLIVNTDLGELKDLTIETLAEAIKVKNPQISEDVLAIITDAWNDGQLDDTATYDTLSGVSVDWTMSKKSPKYIGSVKLTYTVKIPNEAAENDLVYIDAKGNVIIWDEENNVQPIVIQVGYDLETGEAFELLGAKHVPASISENITSLNGIFVGSKEMNDSNVGLWNTSNIVDMSGVFNDGAFNQDISGWNTSKVTKMTQMFSGTTQFNQDISGWTVSNVTDMEQMFYGAEAFNQNLNGWDVSKVENADFFANKSAFEETNWPPFSGDVDPYMVSNEYAIINKKEK
ncbi:BspA family leucine-rich repeat surface protein [[Acholeplasma] multilocale]|uniref:BspA family leucine-rich repeat surface protein n=1 Tax=[Acholeplasma] multilocale TaxID=264638 RepID=UPI000686A744|nr:BspA family leucine-rich repeat surface protein [[Acholeplasma] multilocale]